MKWSRIYREKLEEASRTGACRGLDVLMGVEKGFRPGGTITHNPLCFNGAIHGARWNDPKDQGTMTRVVYLKATINNFDEAAGYLTAFYGPKGTLSRKRVEGCNGACYN